MDLRLVGLAVLVLGVAVAAIWQVGRLVRGELGPLSRAEKGRGAPEDPSVPPQVVRTLQQRGLVTPAQLAQMSETERQLLFSSVTSVVSKEVETDAGPRLSGAHAVIHAERLPPLFCPTCGYRLERFTSTPPITGQCETCGAKVVVRRDGARILLTVLPKGEPDARRVDLRLEP
jgi:DNA-directed RNA polymerase subunit RPC12/RpoP